MDLLKIAKSLAERVEAGSIKTKVPVALIVIDSHGNITTEQDIAIVEAAVR